MKMPMKSGKKQLFMSWREVLYRHVKLRYSTILVHGDRSNFAWHCSQPEFLYRALCPHAIKSLFCLTCLPMIAPCISPELHKYKVEVNPLPCMHKYPAETKPQNYTIKKKKVPCKIFSPKTSTTGQLFVDGKSFCWSKFFGGKNYVKETK